MGVTNPNKYSEKPSTKPQSNVENWESQSKNKTNINKVHKNLDQPHGKCHGFAFEKRGRKVRSNAPLYSYI